MQFNEFDFPTLLRLLRRKAKVILVNSFVAAIIGFLIALCIPKEYESAASIIPENGTQENNGLSTLSTMTGLDLGNGEDAIGPQLYPTVVFSNRFITNLLYTPVQTIDGNEITNLLTYIKEYTRHPWWSYVNIYIGKLMKKLNPPDNYNARTADEPINPERLSRDDEMLLEYLKGSISCIIDDKTGMINISFRAQDPLVAKTVVDTLMLRLQLFITDYRTNKARIDLQHYQEIEKETHEKFDETQQAYADYCDTHMGTLLQTYQSEMEALETEMSVALNAYTQVKQQVQMAEAKVQEKTPAFTIVETASVPARHASPHKLLMAIAFAFLVCFGTIACYYIRLLLGKDIA